MEQYSLDRMGVGLKVMVRIGKLSESIFINMIEKIHFSHLQNRSGANGSSDREK